MPKENKSTNRRNRRQCPEVDNEAAASCERGSIKSVIGSNRYSPFAREPLRRDSKMEKKMPSTEVLHSVSSGFIENGIKYIMFPLHLLRFCIFGTSSDSVDSVKSKEAGQAKSSNEKDERQEDEKKSKDREESSTKEREDKSAKVREGKSTNVQELKEEKSPKEREGKSLKEREERSTKVVQTSKDRSSQESRTSSKSNSNSETKDTSTRKEDSKTKSKCNEESSDEMVTAEEDSDSSTEQWSNATSTMVMNMSMDYDNIDKSMSFALLEEPMDISMEEHVYEKSCSAIKTSRDNFANFQASAVGNLPSKLYRNEQSSNSSVDEEIARIFQKQCTSSDDEVSSARCKSSAAYKRERTKQNSFLYDERSNDYSAIIFRSRKEKQDNDRERPKKTSSDVIVHHKRRKVTHDEDRNERRNDRRTETKMREEKRGSRHDTPNKYKTRSSRTPVKNKESKRKDVKYKETATQTDSAFSDDDIEMISVDTKPNDKQFYCKYTAQRLQSNPLQAKVVDQELNYIADNEDSTDGFLRIARKRISSSSTSSSSTDLGFDEHISGTPDTDIAMGQWLANADSVFRICRAPPGFPKFPQNPPLTSCTFGDFKQLIAGVTSRDNCPNSSIIQTSAIVPRAPSPMRHLYYDYPEFMDFPANVNSSKILKNILRNNYYR